MKMLDLWDLYAVLGIVAIIWFVVIYPLWPWDLLGRRKDRDDV